MEDGAAEAPVTMNARPPAPLPAGRRETWGAGLVMAAGLLHLVLVGDHLAHALGAGLFFFTLGATQAVWAAAYLRRPSDSLRRWGLAALAVAPTVLYLVTRMARAPWSDGPEAWDAAGIATQLLQIGAAVALMPTRRTALRFDGVAAIGVGLLLAAGGYAGALGAEGVDFLSQARSVHGHDDGDGGAGHEDEHAVGASGAGGAHAGAHAGHGTSLVGTRGESMVGSIAYYGPPDGPAIATHCQAIGQAQQECWLHFLTEVLIAEGSVVAFQTLADLAAAERAADAVGHPLAHSLGHAAFQAYGLDVQLALRECSYEVFQGCIHGVLQAHFDDLAAQGLPLDGPALNAVCGYAETSFERYACVHGLGHGIMMYEGLELHVALDRCALLRSGNDRTNCYGGVFMENVVGFFDSLDPSTETDAHGDGEPQFWVDENEPAYPCNVVAEAYKSSCWRMQTSLILHFNKGDFRAASVVCTAAEPYNLDCFDSLGRDSVPYSDRIPASMSAKCTYARADEEARCVHAFTTGMILHFNDPEQGLLVCQPLPVHQKEACYRATGIQTSRMLTAAETEQVCARAEPDYVAACRDGAS